jgi:hypothetical protein
MAGISVSDGMAHIFCWKLFQTRRSLEESRDLILHGRLLLESESEKSPSNWNRLP